MRSRTLVQVAAGVLISLLAWPAQLAYAQKCAVASARRIKKLNFDAMDENDRWELTKARQKLEDAKLVAQSRKCLAHPELAVTYVILGVLEQRSRKPAAMKAAWEKALTINPKADLPKRLRSAKTLRMFRSVKARFKPKVRVAPRPGVPKGPPKGFEHVPILQWEEGKTLTVAVRAANSMAIQRVSLFYKTETAAVKRVELLKKGVDKYSWSVTIEGQTIRGKELKYYLVAYATGDKEVAASGNSASMHIIQLTSAAVAKRRSGEENPLTGGVLRRRARRVATKVDHALEDPDQPRRRAITVKKTVKGPKKGGSGFGGKAHLFASLSAGTGIGLMGGTTEVTGEDVPGDPSLGAVFTQFELGYLITKQFSINFYFRLGFMLTSDEVKDPEKDGYYQPLCTPTGSPDCLAKEERNRYDYVGLLRVRWQTKRLLKASLPINLRVYVGGGIGFGIVRHLVSAKLGDPDTLGSTRKVIDTDKSMGVIPNVFAGVSLCVIRSCAVNVHLEVNYMAAIWQDTDLNTPFHMDFSLGANFAF